MPTYEYECNRCHVRFDAAAKYERRAAQRVSRMWRKCSKAGEWRQRFYDERSTLQPSRIRQRVASLEETGQDLLRSKPSVAAESHCGD